MERVGLELQTTAHDRRNTQSDLDLFGRSAFNRYYYATFLSVRTLLRICNPKWKGSHDSVPNELEGWITSDLRKLKKGMEKINDKQAVVICNAATAAAADLAQLMRKAYSVRVIADYEPDIPIVLEGTRFALQQTTITDAHSWPAQAKQNITKIERAWRLKK